MTRWVLHVDLDQFLAAVEMLRRPELAGRPVVVGGDGDPTKRGVVATASYAARACGVHSGVPLRTAARRCLEAVFLPVDKEHYKGVSAQVMAALRELDAVVEVLGWDEAFLAVETDDPEAYAREVQDLVRARTRLESSVGIGENRLQAKIATGFGKPAGVFALTADTWFDVLGDREPDALWGVGRKTVKRLAGLGITTVSELAAAGRVELVSAFGPANGPWLIRLANGRDRTPVVGTPYVPRSRSREVTFQRDLEDWSQVTEQVRALARQVAADVRSERRAADRVVVKVRFAPFFTTTHGSALDESTSDVEVLERAALAALERFEQRRPVRLLGVRAEFRR